MRCERCGGENPADARFCIDCGAALAPATTGPTTRLAGVPCPSCNSTNPENARFCVVCGRGLVAGAVSRPRPAPTRPAVQHNFPRVDAWPAPVQMGPAARPPHRSAAHNPQIGALVFLGGLLVLLLTRSIWPGILLLIGISSLVGQSNRGRLDKGLMSLVWWGGLALLFATGTFWPGILVLFFLSMMFGGGCRPHGRWHW
jgi:hypothetical protein